MIEERGIQSSKFLNVVDQELRESIIRLDQKLKGLNAEIVARIESIRNTGGTVEQIDALTVASEDVAKAISGIQELVNAVVSDDLTNQQFLKLNQESLEILRDVFANHLASISQLKEKI